jgi:hypothetical protein
VKYPLLKHWDVDKKCAAEAFKLLQNTRYTDFTMFDRATVNRGHGRAKDLLISRELKPAEDKRFS